MNKCFGFGQGWIGDAEDCIACKKTNNNKWKKCKKKTDQLIKDANLTDEEVEEYIRKKKENK